jgi:hypothetical protein
MGRGLELKQSLIEPTYLQAEPNQSIDLGTVAVKFAYGGKEYQEKAQVSMRFIPDNLLLFVIPDRNESPKNAEHQPMTADQIKAALCPPFHLDNKWDGKLELTDRGVVLDVFEKGCGGNYGAVSFVPKRSAVEVTSKHDAIPVATFHLFNFPKFHGPDDYLITWGDNARGGAKLCGRIVLRADGWVITIAAMDKTGDLCNALDREGGYIVTHMGHIEREDGSAFTSDQLNDILRCMHYFLSFALGRWAGVALPVGLDKTGNRVFEEWGTPIVAAGAWHGTCSWFDDRHAELLPEVFGGFMVLWKDKTWSAAFREALHWYLGANERGTGITVEMGLILAQTALELLAWTHCVQSRKMISADAFEPRGLSAADKIRLLASSLGIPLDIPASLPALRAKRGSRWQDASDAITGIRNAVVHPRVKKNVLSDSYYQAWNLSMWYLDMILLRLCRHKGKYANRLMTPRWAGQVELVPWAKSESGKVGD